MAHTEGAGSIDKAIDVLFHLHATGEPQGVTAVSRALGLPKSSVHRMLSVLARRGLVEQDAAGLTLDTTLTVIGAATKLLFEVIHRLDPLP